MNRTDVLIIACFGTPFVGVLVLATPVTRAYADSCFIFCVTIQQPGPPPYNATSIDELINDPDKADSAINLEGNDHLKAIWHSGKPISQFTAQEKIDLEIAAKKLASGDSVTILVRT